MLWIEEKYVKLIGSQLQLFKHLRNHIYNFRCPICGDSDKSRTKTRGYFYDFKNHMNFRCHNCGASMSLYNFLKDFDTTLFNDLKMELFREGKHNKRIIEQPKKLIFPQSRHKPFPVKKRDFYGLDPISELADDNIAVQYLHQRLIPRNRWDQLYYVDQMVDIAKKFKDYNETKFDYYPRLLIPFINQDGIITHIQGRALGDNIPNSKRYITLEVELDQPKIYGLQYINKSLNMYIVEGPFDSMFLHNCVAMGGADIDFSQFDPSKTTFIFDNEPRAVHVLKRMQKVSDMGYGVCVWGDSIKEKDINDLVIGGMSPDILMDYVKKHSYRGLKSKLEIAKFNKR